MARADETPPPTPDIIQELVDRFERNRDAYRAGAYNETQVRREFIDPLFAALGWDVDNEQGLAEAYKDVIHEDAIRIGAATKAPDYCFRIGGTRKFFVEAKRPSVGVHDEPEPAYQLRRYAWSARLPLSILTDFEELAVYDCRLRPNKTDKASKARLLYFTYGEYADRWQELASIFSKEAVLRGSFDKYAETSRGKRGTAPVDEEFLNEIEGWRESLAKNFAIRNEKLSVRDLNFAVERTIDRIIFLRMCEDRGIERYGGLQALLNGSAVYGRLAQLFRAADDKYNAGLFYFRQEAERGPPDELTLGLTLDDKVLKEILVRLYYPDSPYEFSVLPPEILGQVYEQFLGKVIRLTAGHQAKVEEKPEVRKAGGVYYTPTYIVDYIVKHTVGKLLEGKTPADVGPDRETKTGKRRKVAKGTKMLRVLDPACGSGSFLLGAYQYLLDWHRDWYVANRAGNEQARDGERGPLPDGRGSDPYRDRIYQGAGGVWRLSIREKKRILLNNIYGVDIDPQAVEVTKLSLLLKVLEHESAETLGSTLRLFHERALPDLSDNIKCGNSLIGPDFYEGRQRDLFDEEERYRINAFDWKAEFPDVFAPIRAPTVREGSTSDREGPVGEQGPLPHGRGSDLGDGFDAVIGNPPYLKIEHIETVQRDYFSVGYRTIMKRFDAYGLFVERATEILGQSGMVGLIIPSTMLNNLSFSRLRQMLLTQVSVTRIVNLGGHVFHGVNNDTLLIFYTRPPSKSAQTEIIDVTEYGKKLNSAKSLGSRALTSIALPPHFTFDIRVSKRDSEMLLKMQGSRVTIGDYCACFQGFVTGSNDAYIVDDRAVDEERLEREKCRPAVFGDGVGRYEPPSSKWFVIFLTRNDVLDSFPNIKRRLIPFRDVLASKREVKLGRQPWYALHWPRPAERHEISPKILVQAIRNLSLKRRIVATRDDECLYADHTLNVLYLTSAGHHVNFILGCLNSSLANYYFLKKHLDINVKGVYLTALPLPKETSAHPNYDRVVALVDELLIAKRSLITARTEHEKATLQRQIDATDRQIDQLVYQLYGLTEEEIRIVEEGTKQGDRP